MLLLLSKFIIELPEYSRTLQAGGYIQIEIPEGEVKYDGNNISAHQIIEHPGKRLNLNMNGINLIYGL